MLLNNANNDTNSGIIVAASEASDSTYVTSSDNEVVDVDISITEEDGKKYMTYAIGSNEKRVEITSSDVTIYVKSSARVDSKDTNGVNVSVANDTDLSVYFKVVDDDSSEPRFNLSKKAGVVKVY